MKFSPRSYLLRTSKQNKGNHSKKNISLTIKVSFLTILIGAFVWIALDNMQFRHLKQLFSNELAKELEKHAKGDRSLFDRHIQRHRLTVELILLQRNFQDYVFSRQWLKTEKTTTHYYHPPAWMSPTTIIQDFFNASHALLIDAEGYVREVYHHLPEELPPALLEPNSSFQELSRGQLYITDISGFLYILTAQSFNNPQGERVGTLLLVSPINSEFLQTAMGELRPDVTISLLTGEPRYVVVSSHPALLPKGLFINTLEKDFLIAGNFPLDYGASNLNLQFASFIATEKACRLTSHVLKASRKHGFLIAFILILSFTFLTLWIIYHIKRVTEQIVTFSKESLEIEMHRSGDEIAQIVMLFEQLRDSIGKTVTRAKAIAAGDYSYETEEYTQQDRLGRALSDMNYTLQTQAQELREQHITLCRLNDELEQRVSERTEALETANRRVTDLYAQLQEETLRMAAELNVAQRLQQMVLPKEHELKQVSGLDIAGFMEAAEEVGGDYYDVIQHNGHLKIGIGDVTGHGLESGVLMLMVQMAVRTLLASDVFDPIHFLNVLNQAIYENIQRMNLNKNLTLVLLDYQQGVLNISGQHEEILIVRKNGEVERIDTFDLGFMVGLKSDISAFISQLEVQLYPGDGFVLYTDGITEARNSEEIEYGVERLCEIVSRHWHNSAIEIQKAVITDVRCYVGEQKIHDDLTLLVLKQLPIN